MNNYISWISLFAIALINLTFIIKYIDGYIKSTLNQTENKSNLFILIPFISEVVIITLVIGLLVYGVYNFKNIKSIIQLKLNKSTE